MKYGFCINHPKTYAVNAKRLCAICTKERHERSAESKGMTIKKKEDGYYYKRKVLQRDGDSALQALQIYKTLCNKKKEYGDDSLRALQTNKWDDGTDNTRLPKSYNRLQKPFERDREPQIPIPVQKQVAFKKTKIKPVSKDKEAELRTLSKIKESKIRLHGKECELCGKSGDVDLFHIISVGDKKHSTNPLNTLLSCRFCHLLWGANDWSKIVKFRNFSKIMERLKALDEGKYWKLKHKIEKHEEHLG